MGTKGRQIVGLDIDELLEALNKAYADEWLAHYQYWLGAKIVKGPMKESIEAELIEHSTDEQRHADMLADRIIQLGGTPLTHPSMWFDATTCGYEEPTSEFVKDLLVQNIKGEQCAIEVYQELINMTRDKDPVTYQIVLEILKDEVMHEEELQALEEDLQYLMMQGS
ncbi:MAG: ferritin-like domain-containing protein [Brevefilum sp.]